MEQRISLTVFVALAGWLWLVGYSHAASTLTIEMKPEKNTSPVKIDFVNVAGFYLPKPFHRAERVVSVPVPSFQEGIPKFAENDIQSVQFSNREEAPEISLVSPISMELTYDYLISTWQANKVQLEKLEYFTNRLGAMVTATHPELKHKKRFEMVIFEQANHYFVMPAAIGDPTSGYTFTIEESGVNVDITHRILSKRPPLPSVVFAQAANRLWPSL